MDCSDAMRIVSERLDNAEIDPSDLEAAKLHCKSCKSCARYVSALVAIERTPAPEPPESLVDDIMGRVRAEAAAAAPHLEEAEATSEDVPTEGPVQSVIPLSARLKDPRTRVQLVAWASAAAVIFIGAGFLALAGARQILTPATRSASVSSQPEYGATAPSDDAALSAGSADVAGESSAASATVAPDYIVVGASVYRSSGLAAGVDEATLQPKGTTTTSLDEGPPPSSREVLGLQDPGRVYVRNDDGSLLAFDRVTRSFQGRVYVLQSAPIDEFGQWPTPPPSVNLPSPAAGTAGMSESGSDDLGVAVYVPAGASPSAGIAVPPGTGASDPAAANPEWTWWAPAGG